MSACHTELFRSMVLLPAALSVISIHGQCQGSPVNGTLALPDKHNTVYLAWRHFFSFAVTLARFPKETKPSEHVLFLSLSSFLTTSEPIDWFNPHETEG